MKFITKVDIPSCPWKISYQSKILMLGSCFTENIGQRLAELKYDIDLNPFGILYNPVSIANSLSDLIHERQFSENDLFFDQGVWNSFSHHSRFSGIEKEPVLQTINARIKESAYQLKNADFLFITLGTSWVYKFISTGKIVSNCHKVPSREFHRSRLSTDEIVSIYRELIERLLKFNSKLKIVFTVSPIRHWKDGAIENQVSKATLLLAVDQLKNHFGTEHLYYFPSYEIQMDELRDYRYYASDMLHLSDVAIEYIYNKFSKIMISDDSLKLSEDVVKIQKAIAHRPFNSASNEYQSFLLYNLEQIERLTKNFPFLNFKIEKTYFQNCLLLFEKK